MARGYSDLSDEQKRMVDEAMAGRNVLVDACIGSGKTTAIQCLCSMLAAAGKRVLYLTYNKLLKYDAQEKIKEPGVKVTNYHGFAMGEMYRAGYSCGVGDVLAEYARVRPAPPWYDVMVVDEYQDINTEAAAMLEHIKASCPGLQRVIVGDMEQKIYDSTSLDVASFIKGFLSDGYVPLEFTRCFRLCERHAKRIGEAWGKKITGVNTSCRVVKMGFPKVVGLLSQKEPGEVLVLGPNGGLRDRLLNVLEHKVPEKFNKNTVYARIMDKDGGAAEPTPDCAVFTTFDGCKGMERDTCVVIGWTDEYWNRRLNMPNVDAKILRNIFLVAASRGKGMIVFVEPDLQFETVGRGGGAGVLPKQMDMSTMFDFKFQEDVDAAHALLDIQLLQPAGDPVEIAMADGMIDLTPCIGIYNEAVYFRDYDIDTHIYHALEARMQRRQAAGGTEDEGVKEPDVDFLTEMPLIEKILYLTYLMTGQARYCKQVGLPFVPPQAKDAIIKRLSSILPDNCEEQRGCGLMVDCMDQRGCSHSLGLTGFTDAVHMDRVWELKFVSQLSKTHFLQLASYLVATGIEEGVLWNVRDGQMYRVKRPDPRAFIRAVVRCVSKHSLTAVGAEKYVYIKHDGRAGGTFVPAGRVF